jgi:hypothetical protein
MKTLCPHCKMLIPYSARLAGREARCPVCGEPFDMPSPDEQAKLIQQDDALRREQARRFEHARQRRTLAAAEAGRYPALRFIAGLLQFLALLVLVAALVSLVAVALSNAPWEAKLWRIALSFGFVLMGPVLLWGLGELILLLIDVANDMRATRQEITRLRRRKG